MKSKATTNFGVKKKRFEKDDTIAPGPGMYKLP